MTVRKEKPIIKIAGDIYKALNEAPSDHSALPECKSWSDMSKYSNSHIVTTVTIIARSREPARVSIYKIRCLSCNWEGLTGKMSRMRCPICGSTHIQFELIGQVEFRTGKVTTVDGTVLDAVFIGDAIEMKPGRRRVIAYLTWLDRGGSEEPVLVITREVKVEEKPTRDLVAEISSIPDWKARLNAIVDIVANNFKIIGLRPHILFLLSMLVSGHGIPPFIESTDVPRRLRWWIHGCILGDPATGKSTLVEVVRRCVPHGRCILLSGPAITIPGLTVGVALGYPTDGALLLLDGGPEDFGVLVLEEMHTADIKLLHQIKDALERGEFYRAIAGHGQIGGLSRVSILMIANFKTKVFRGEDSLPDFIRDPAFADRMDFILFTFRPDKELSKEITRRTLMDVGYEVTSSDIANYIEHCRKIRIKAIVNPDKVLDILEDASTRVVSSYQALGIYKSPERTKESLARLSIAAAKLALLNVVTPEVVEYVASILEDHLDKTHAAYLEAYELHAAPASKYVVTKTILEVLEEAKRELTREEIIEKVQEKLRRRFYKCSEDMIEEALNRLKEEGKVIEPELGKYKLIA